MSLIAPAQGLRRWPSLTSFFQRGVTPNEIWYALGCQNQTAFSTRGLFANSIFALPFPISRPAPIDRIAFEVSTGGAANARVAIYRNSSPNAPYPSTLVVESGEHDCAVAGVKSSVVSVTLAPGIYWAAINASANAGVARALTAVSQNPIRGALSTLAGCGSPIVVSSAYGAFPASFPGGAVDTPAGMHIVGVRFAA